MTFKPDPSLDCAVIAAKNFNQRVAVHTPDILLLHYTGMESGQAALDWLVCEESQVSCHYLVEEDGTIVQMVPENLRAWHAGKSCWEGTEDINSRSIGIEIVNPGHEFGYRAFSKRQIEAVIALGLDVVKRNGILPTRVLAHSDVAPGRKQDPGELFPWDVLHRYGLGHRVEPAPVQPQAEGLTEGSEGEVVKAFQTLLCDYGYGLAATGRFGADTRAVLKAFQLHFRPARVDGVADASTIDTLSRLVASAAK